MFSLCKQSCPYSPAKLLAIQIFSKPIRTIYIHTLCEYPLNPLVLLRLHLTYPAWSSFDIDENDLEAAVFLRPPGSTGVCLHIWFYVVLGGGTQGYVYIRETLYWLGCLLSCIVSSQSYYFSIISWVTAKSDHTLPTNCLVVIDPRLQVLVLNTLEREDSPLECRPVMPRAESRTLLQVEGGKQF